MLNREKLIETMHRVFLSLIFFVAGAGHLLNPDKILKRLSGSPMSPYLEVLAPLSFHVFASGFFLVIGSLGLSLGLRTRLSSLLLIALLIPITISVQLQGAETIGPFFKNVALLGGLTYFAYFGPKGWSLDARKAKILFIALLTLTQIPQSMASEIVPVDKLVILLKKEEHLRVAELTVREGIKGEDRVKLQSVTIIACGKEIVPLLRPGASTESVIKSLQEFKVDLVACGISLKKASIDPKSLLSGIRVVPNGLTELIRLKGSGYLGVEL